jgi:hypothetical protein
MADPEIEFLQLCLRAQCDAAALGLVRHFINHVELDWSRVQIIAADQRLGPSIYDVTRNTGIVPASVEQALEQSYHDTARRNLVLWHELRLVLDALKAAGIPVLVLKGAALAETVYRNVALRPMADVDLLVAPGNVARLIDVLRPLGFLPPQVEMRAGTIAAFENEILLCAPKRADFDIHWSLFDSPFHQYTVSMDWFWETARPLAINDTKTLMLGPEATLLHLCGHIWLHHGGETLLGLHDAARTVAFDPGPFDWDELLRRARTYNLVLPTQRVLDRIAELWKIALPADVHRRVAAMEPSTDEARTLKWLATARLGTAHRLWADLRSIPGWRQRLRFAWTLMLPSALYMRVRYGVRHPVLLPAYYVYRWIRGLRSAL